jgi:hypothetical protein
VPAVSEVPLELHVHAGCTVSRSQDSPLTARSVAQLEHLAPATERLAHGPPL